MSVVRKLTKVGEQVFSSGVGMGSREQLVGFDLPMMASSADDVTSLKLQRVMPVDEGRAGGWGPSYC